MDRPVQITVHEFTCDKCGVQLTIQSEDQNGWYNIPNAICVEQGIKINGLWRKIKGELCGKCRQEEEDLLIKKLNEVAEEFNLRYYEPEEKD